MKISVFTAKFDQKKKERWAAILQAARIAEKQKSKLLILPGWSTLRKKEGGLKKIKELSKKHKISILYDSRGTNEDELGKSFVVTPEKIVGPFNQLFYLSKEAEKSPSLVKKLICLLENGKRSFKISRKNFSVLLCGENNFLKNSQNNGNKPIVRHKFKFDTSSYDVLINQSHTTMGNWPKLIKRFEWLSQGEKYVVFLVNNNTTGNNWKSSINIFYDGKRIMTGEPPCGVGIQKFLDWRIVTITIN